MIQTAEGAMSVIDEKLTRMKELAEQAATGTYTTAQREIINSEYQAMAAEIDRIANATDFNGVKLLDGTMAMGHEGSGMKIHFGTGNDAAEDYYYINTGDVRATYATGLRVGNSDPRDTLRTNNLRALSQTAALDQGRGEASTFTDGFFGIRFTENFNAEYPEADYNEFGGAQWHLYGYVDVDVSRTSINDIVQEINKGAQAQGLLTLTAGTTVGDLVGNAITINNKILNFVSSGSGPTYDTTLGTGDIDLDGLTTTAQFSAAICNYLNNYRQEIGVYGVRDAGTTLHLIAHKFGADGNNINTVSNFAAIKTNQETLLEGGRQAVTASAFYNVDRGEYELQLQMNRGGEKYQVQTFGFSTIGDATVPTIMGGAITGATFGTDSTSRWMAALTTLSGNAAPIFNGLDETDEWLQVQNGTGRTDWDGADVLTQSNAQRALAALDEAVLKKDTVRAQLGAIQNRLENTITNLQIQAENLQAAESRISDVDVATEMTEFTRNNILAQAATAMLAQANSLPQLALQLIGG
jgi:flagellin